MFLRERREEKKKQFKKDRRKKRENHGVNVGGENFKRKFSKLSGVKLNVFTHEAFFILASGNH